jgi:hypothetical protein
MLLLMALLMFSGCQKKDEGKNLAEVHPSMKPRKASVIVVPDSVKGKWKAVKIAVTDKMTNKESVFTVDIGSSFPVPETKIAVDVENFLPDFTMNGTVMTSQSNETKNPAAKIKIFEKGKEIFNGWLFSLYPTTHAVQHPRFGFTLVGFIPQDSTKVRARSSAG